MKGDGLARVLAALAEHGKTVIARNGGYSAQCAAHPDRTPSLSVDQGEKGAVVNCQVGCDTEDVVAALNLTMKDLFDVPQQRDATPSRVVAEYQYTDARGAVLFVKQRVEPGKNGRPKDFKVYRPMPGGQRAWDLKGLDQRPLYRLPRIIEAIAAGQTVYLVEGEKDVEAAEKAGAVATCNFDGAAAGGQRSKWKPEYGDQLAGAHVVIVEDNDDAGRAHAASAAKDLAGKAASVRVMRGRVDAEHADLSDHLAAGYGLDDLLPAVVDSPPPRASGTAEDAGWDEPIPCDWPTALPEWPDGVFPPVVEEWVYATAEETQTPKDLPGSAALAAVSGAICGRVKVQCPNWQEPTNVWVVPVLAPGSRKSAVIERARGPLAEAEAELIEAKRDEILDAQTRREILEKAAEQAKTAASKDPTQDSIRAAQEAVRDAAEVEVPSWPRLVTSDATPEKLGTILAKHGGRISAISAEAGLFGSLTGRYAKVPNLDPMLQAHAGDTIIVDRQSRDPEHVKDPALTVLVSIQPFAMREMVSRPDFAGRGLLARVLWCLPDDIVGRRKIRGVKTMPPEVADAYRELVKTLAMKLAYRETVTLSLSEDASEALLDFAELVERMLLPEAELGSARLTREWGSKLVGAVARVAGCLHMARGIGAISLPISGDTMHAAIRLGHYFKAHAIAAMVTVDAGKVSAVRYVLEKLIEKGLSEFTVRELHRKVQKRFPTAAEVRQIVTELAERGWVREGVSKEYELHPDARTLLARFDASGSGDTGDTGDSAESAQVNRRDAFNPAVTPPGDTGDRRPSADRSVTLVTPPGDTTLNPSNGSDLHNHTTVTPVTPVTRTLELANTDDEFGEWSA
ncbi:DUF3987 domain-containing protein [Streptosporangium sandarakinum]|uniref:DUF3987 domain-containing protein n=1 Tax=Streptosporangium sandarakinum TaxID=1260955 RepID=UPI0036976D56